MSLTKVTYSMIEGSTVNPHDFGAMGDGIHDDTQAINDAIQAARTTSGVVMFQRNATYKVTGTIKKPVRVILKGNYCTIVPAAGTYIQNYVFLTNSDDGLNWVSTYPATISGQIDAFIFDNTNTLTPNVIAIGMGDASTVTNIVTKYMYGAYHTLANVLFLDQKIIENINTTYHLGTAPMILARNFGDMSTIRNIHPFSPNLTSLVDVIQLNNAKAVTIQNSGFGTNMRMFMKGCRGITLESCTFEDGRVAAESSDFVMSACWFAKKSQGTDGCIKLSRDTTNYFGSVFTATLNNVQFARLLKTAATNIPEYDIVMESEYTLSMNDVYRTTMLNNSIREEVSKTKPLVYSTSASAPHQYNKYAHALDKEYLPAGTALGEINAFSSPVKMADNVNWLSTLAGGGTTWSKPTGTYYYKAQFVVDVDRRIGFTDVSAELSRSVTNSAAYDSGVYIIGGSPNYRNSGRKQIFRLYRGTSAGSYDEYVDIPTTNGITHLFDSGAEINGYFWQSRSAAGVDALYFAQTTYANTETVTVYGITGIPTVGTWKVGDRIYRVPVSGQPKSWVCTVAGTPGTWVSEGNL